MSNTAIDKRVTVKYRRFVSEAMKDKPVSAVAGVGPAIAKELENRGVATAEQLYAKLKEFNFQKAKFSEWMPTLPTLPSVVPRENLMATIYNALVDWDNQFGGETKGTDNQTNSTSASPKRARSSSSEPEGLASRFNGNEDTKIVQTDSMSGDANETLDDAKRARRNYYSPECDLVRFDGDCTEKSHHPLMLYLRSLWQKIAEIPPERHLEFMSDLLKIMITLENARKPTRPLVRRNEGTKILQTDSVNGDANEPRDDAKRARRNSPERDPAQFDGHCTEQPHHPLMLYLRSLSHKIAEIPPECYLEFMSELLKIMIKFENARNPTGL